MEDPDNNLSASDSDSPIPTCMPFSWFGDSHKEHSSSSTLSFSQGGQDIAIEQSQEKTRSKVNVACLNILCILDTLTSSIVNCSIVNPQ